MKLLGSKVSVPFKMNPARVTGHHGYFRDGHAGLEHFGDSMMSQVVEMKVRDAELVASYLKGFADGLWVDAKYEPIGRDYPVHNLPRTANKRNPLIVPFLLPRVFSVPDQDQLLNLIDVIPTQTTDFSTPQTYRYHKANNCTNLSVVFGKVYEDCFKFVLSWASFPPTTTTDET